GLLAGAHVGDVGGQHRRRHPAAVAVHVGHPGGFHAEHQEVLGVGPLQGHHPPGRLVQHHLGAGPVGDGDGPAVAAGRAVVGRGRGGGARGGRSGCGVVVVAAGGEQEGGGGGQGGGRP